MINRIFELSWKRYAHQYNSMKMDGAGFAEYTKKYLLGCGYGYGKGSNSNLSNYKRIDFCISITGKLYQ